MENSGGGNNTPHNYQQVGSHNSYQHSHSQSLSSQMSGVVNNQEQKMMQQMNSHNSANAVNSLYQSNSKDNVKVVIRVRPLNEREKNNGGYKKCVNVENQGSIAIDGYKSFNFDYVADEDVPQNVIFEQIAKPISECCLEGYNGTIFAYGQTGSGKTFTIQGPNQLINGEESIFGSRKRGSGSSSARGGMEENQRGIMQRSFEYIFESLETERSKAEQMGEAYQFEYLIRCSYLEIYNEQIMDLLEPTSVNLHIREDIKKGVYVEGLQEEVVLSAEDMISLIQIGAKNRHVGSHAMNKESSRSHSVLTTIIETKSMKEGGVWNIKTSRFHIIDLAGSERSKQTNAVGERLKEAGMINKSLSALGNVINSLVDISEGKSRHVHYRDSKLTFLLRDSLGGNSKTLIIANVSPSNSCHGETLSTLKFAQRAKLIKNKAVINEDSSGTIQILRAEIGRLKKELAESEKSIAALQNGVPECQRCKAMLEDTETGIRNEDEMLLSFDEGDPLKQDSHIQSVSDSLNQSAILRRKLKQHQKQEINQLRSRVTHLEGLLTANLDSLSNQQKFYENEIQKLHSQQKRMQQTVESYEKQSARDKMIIKFREERISKLEQISQGGGSSSDYDSEQQRLIADLRKEVQMWKEAADHNTQAAKLYAEKSELQNKLDTLKLEVSLTPESLSSQIRSLTELNESLNQYLKSYCEESKNELESELAQIKIDYAEQIESFNIRIQDMNLHESEKQKKFDEKEEVYKQTISHYKNDLQRLEIQFSEERQQLERLNTEALSQLKNEINMQLHNSKTEQDKQVQLLRVDILERDQQIENEREKRLDLERLINQRKVEYENDLREKQQSIKELQAEIQKQIEKQRNLQNEKENDKKNHAEVLKVVEARWDEQVKELETLLLQKQSEMDLLNEQYDQSLEEINGLRQEMERLCQEQMQKDALIQELSDDLKQKDSLLLKQQQNNDRLEQTLSKLKSNLKLLEIQSAQKINESQQTFDHQINELNEKIMTLTKEKEAIFKNLQSQIEQLEKLQGQFIQAQIQLKETEKQFNQTLAEKAKETEIIMEEYVSTLCQEREQNKEHIEKIQYELESDFKMVISQKDAIISGLVNEKASLQEKIQNLLSDSQKQQSEKEFQLNNQIKDLEKQLQSIQEQQSQEISSFSSQLKLLEDEKLQKTTEIQDLEETIETQTQIVNDLKENLKLSREDFESKLQSINYEKENEILSIKNENERVIGLIEQKIEKLTLERMSAEEEMIANFEEEKNQFKIQIEKITNQYEDKIAHLIREKEMEARNQSEKVGAEIVSQMNERIQNLTDEQNQSKLQIEQLNAKLHEAQQIIAIKNNELQQRNDHLQKVSNALSDSQIKLQNYHMETTRLGTQLEQKLSSNDQLLRDLESKQNEIASLRQILQEQMHLLQQTQQESALLSSKMNQADNSFAQQREAFSQEINNLSQQVQELQSLLSTANLKRETLENQINLLEKAQAETNDQKLQSLTVQISKLTNQAQQREQELLEQQSILAQRCDEQDDLLRSCKETISKMRDQQQQQIKDFKDQFYQVQEREEKHKRQAFECKEEAIRAKREADSLKELIRLKDKEIEDFMNADERDRQALEKISRENKELRSSMTKREFEMKDMARTLKFYVEENARLKKDNEKLCKENDQLIGHKNPSQKIQHHVRIKEENNRLKEENLRLQDELRRYLDIKAKGSHRQFEEQSSQQNSDHKKQNENMTTSQFETAALRLLDHLFSQPSLTKAVNLTDQMCETLLHPQQSTVDKVKKAMELITNLNESYSKVEQKLRDMERDVRKYESLLSISERERVMSQQQQREMIHSPILQLNSQTAVSNYHVSNTQTLPSQSAIMLNKENVQQIQQIALQSKGTFKLQSSDQLQHYGAKNEIKTLPIGFSQGAGSLNMNQVPNNISKKESQPSKIYFSSNNVELIAHQVRGGSSRRLVSGVAAAFINGGVTSQMKESSSHQQHHQQQK